MGFSELIENPERMPESIKSILIAPQVSSKLLSTRNVKPSCSYFASVSFGSSRASPKEGPDQPPPMSATRRAESILFWSMYDFKFCVANSVTSNIWHTPYILFNVIIWVLSHTKTTDKAESCRQTYYFEYFNYNIKEYLEISQCRKRRRNVTQCIFLWYH